MKTHNLYRFGTKSIFPSFTNAIFPLQRIVLSEKFTYSRNLEVIYWTESIKICIITRSGEPMRKILFLYFIFILPAAAVSETLYDLLGVSNDCSQEELKTSYRRMRGVFHPDRNKAPDAQQKFQEIQEAYEILSSPGLRAKYDSWIETDEYQNEFGNGDSQSTAKEPDDDEETAEWPNDNEETVEESDSKSSPKADQRAGNSELHLAISRQWRLGEPKDYHQKKIIQMILSILEEPTDLNAQNSWEETPLSLAIQRDLPKVIRFLLYRGANPKIPDRYGDNALHTLIIRRKRFNETDGYHQNYIISLARAMIKKSNRTNLLNAKNNNGRRPLHMAILWNLPNVAEWIISQGGAESLEEKERIFLSREAVTRDQIEVVRLLKNLKNRNVIQKSDPSKPSAKGRSFDLFDNLCQRAFAWLNTIEL